MSPSPDRKGCEDGNLTERNEAQQEKQMDRELHDLPSNSFKQPHLQSQDKSPRLNANHIMKQGTLP